VSAQEPVIACTLGPTDLTDQVARWDRLRRQAEIKHLLTEDGVRLEFRDDAGIESELRALVTVEAECCAWATWTLTREAPKIVLQVSSTGDGIPALHALFGHAS
jgi:hypothetical protein